MTDQGQTSQAGDRPALSDRDRETVQVLVEGLPKLQPVDFEILESILSATFSSGSNGVTMIQAIRRTLDNALEEFGISAGAFIALIDMNRPVYDHVKNELHETTRAHVDRLRRLFSHRLNEAFVAGFRGPLEWRSLDTEWFNVQPLKGPRVSLKVERYGGDTVEFHMSPPSMARFVRSLSRRMRELPQDYLEDVDPNVLAQAENVLREIREDISDDRSATTVKDTGTEAE